MKRSLSENDPNAVSQLLHAYELLASALDDERIIIGPISRRWIASETECHIPLNKINIAHFQTIRGKEILLNELYPELSISPRNFDPSPLFKQNSIPQKLINTNHLPKLEPMLHVPVLMAVILRGIAMFGDKGRGVPSLDDSVLLGGLLHMAIGKRDQHVKLYSAEAPKIDVNYIAQRFGPQVAMHADAIDQAYKKFLASDLSPESLASITDNPLYANVIAARCAAELRLVARAAGEQIFFVLDNEQRTEMLNAGVIFSEHQLPERHYLERNFIRTKSAFRLPGVDFTALKEPLENTLLDAVNETLLNPKRATRMVGRRGLATQVVHTNLPLVEYFSPAEHPNAVETLMLAAFEMSRYLDRCRRKSAFTMPAHAFRIAAAAAETLGNELDVSVGTTALLHDLAEDASPKVSGYDQSLGKIKLRFGGPIAAMVSEVTDSDSEFDATSKAENTYDHPTLVTPREQYDVDRFTEMNLCATNAAEPYTLAGIIVKLLDTAVTFEEGVRDPDMMAGWWQYSGVRVFWAQNVRGIIIRPLVERVVREIRLSEMDGHYFKRGGSLSPDMIQGMRKVLKKFFNAADCYAMMNLCLLGDEYALDAAAFSLLRNSFFDGNMRTGAFERRVINAVLDDKKLDAVVASGHMPDRTCSTLFPRNLESEQGRRDTSTFMAYRKTCLRRMEIRRELNIANSDDIRELQQLLDEVTEHHRRIFSRPEIATNDWLSDTHPQTWPDHKTSIITGT